MIATAPFGSTGHRSSRTIFGAVALARLDQAAADRTMELVVRHGVNHVDTAASYGDSELRLGPWMARERRRFFLATKSGERLRGPARDELHRSLDRLRTDHVDLWQLHNLVDPTEWAVALGPGGALEAAIEARDEGLVRFIGVTGHGIEVAARHLASLERFPFDSVLLPYNYVMMSNPRYAAAFEALVQLCAARGVAVQTIKSTTRRPWSGPQPADRPTWYEPLEDPTAIDLSVRWVLGRPDLFLNTVGDPTLLPWVLEAAARGGERPSDAAMRALVDDAEMAPLFT